MRFTELSEEGRRKLKQLLDRQLKRKVKKEPNPGCDNLDMRRYPRHVLGLPVECWKINSPVIHAGRLINASHSGLLVHLSEKVEIGQHLKLTPIVGSGPTPDTLDKIVQVVWVDMESSGDRQAYRVGVKIADMPSNDRLKIEDFSGTLSE